MRRLRNFFRRVRSLVRAETIHREIEEEARFHIEMRIDENMRRGMSPEDARQDAERRFGNPTRVKERGYEVRGARWLETWSQDLRFGARMLWKKPAFTLIAITTLALGIGANTAIFTLINAVFLRPLPVSDPARLISIFGMDEKNRSDLMDFSGISWPNFKDYRDQNDVFTGMTAFQYVRLNFPGGGKPQQITGMIVTGNYFDLLGVNAAIGRTFLPEEDRTPGTHPVVVLSYGAWRRRFGGDPAIAGRAIKLSGLDYTVVGVAAEGFKGTDAIGGVDCWVPMMMHDQVFTGVYRSYREGFNGRRAPIFNVIGRLKPGITEQQAETAMRAIGRRLEQDFPKDNDQRNVTLIPLNQSPPQQRSVYLKVSGLLFAVVGLVLLIACANVANLLLAQAAARRKEISLRMALGAGRARLIRQLLTESLMLAVAGSGVGLLLAVAGCDLLRAFRPPFIDTGGLNLSFDPRVLGYTLLLSLLTGVIFGLAPALQTTRTELVTELKEKGSQAGRGQRWFSLRNLLVVGQVALSLVALIAAGLFLRSLSNAWRINLGFEAEKLLVVMFDDIEERGYDKARGMEHYRRAVERVEAIPGVISAAIASRGPFAWGVVRTVYVEGQEPPGGGRGIIINAGKVDTKYFETMRIPLVGGRNFTEADRENTPPVVVINEAMAKRFWPNQDAVGKRFRFFGSDGSQEVIGVVKDSTALQIGEAPRPVAYQSLLQDFPSRVILHVRTAGDPSALLATVQREVQALDRTMPLWSATISHLIGEQLWNARIGAALLAVFGLLALILASVGIYGVLASSVSQRTSEFGIRLALGARPSDVLRLVLGQTLTLVAAGTAVGITAGLIVMRMVTSLLYGVSAVDPVTFIGMPLLLLLVALLASYLPALRATKIDPMIALKCE
jgi:putative ABC transport system permease protein